MSDILLAEANEKGRLLSEALEIIEKLSKNSLADQDRGEDSYPYNEIEEVKTLIVKARSLISDRWWYLLR